MRTFDGQFSFQQGIRYLFSETMTKHLFTLSISNVVSNSAMWIRTTVRLVLFNTSSRSICRGPSVEVTRLWRPQPSWSIPFIVASGRRSRGSRRCVLARPNILMMVVMMTMAVDQGVQLARSCRALARVRMWLSRNIVKRSRT